MKLARDIIVIVILCGETGTFRRLKCIVRTQAVILGIFESGECEMWKITDAIGKVGDGFQFVLSKFGLFVRRSTRVLLNAAICGNRLCVVVKGRSSLNPV